MTLANLFLGESQQETPQEPARYTLLLVDDEVNVLSALKRVFKEESYHVLTAENGAEALDILDKETVHLIIADHRMPGMSGADLLRTVRANHAETIRIMLTGYADVESIMGAVNEGAVFKFMTKPWQDDDLRITVARAFEQYQLQKEVRALRTQNQQQEERIQAFSAVLSEERGLLAKVLLREKKITAKQFEEVVREQRRSSELMYRVVQNTVGLSEDDIARTLEKAVGADSVDLREVRISPEAAGLLPPEFCRENLLLPIRLEDGVLTVAMADPSDIFKRENLEMLLGVRVSVVMAKGSELEGRITGVYGTMRTEEEGPVDAIEAIDIVIEDTEEETNVEELLSSSGVPPVVRIVNAVLSEALRLGASDIHIEPRVKHTAVRLRIDGLLQDRMCLPTHVQAAVASRIKILAKMDIAEKRRPQDGRITIRAPDRMVDLRVSTLPTMHGENLVLRLLDRGGQVRSIEALGLNEENLERVRTVICRPQGMLICSGPTGSGKTTMLYSLLREHLRPTCSYGTIEDPVEYYIETAAQVHVREKTGLTFPVALRSMLRQDPDVILVGEVRDQETAQIAFQAALTGHLVLSTLHTNSAVASVTRLVNLGVERYLIASGLETVIAQRLLRTVCTKCKRPVEPEEDVLRLLDLSAEDIGEIQKGTGCDRCNQTGYTGRSGAFEVLSLTDRLRELILAGSRQSELLEVAREDGMRTLFEDAIGKVKTGVTTLDEVLRVLGPSAAPGRPCPGCATPLEPTFTVCPLCGYAVRHLCPKCSMHLVKDWKYCPTCGRPRDSDLKA